MVEKTYCVVHRRTTGNKNITYETTSNGRKIMKSTCSEGNHKKSQFVKTSSGGSGSKIRYHPLGGSFDIHKAILKVAPKKGFVLPGHKYTGPGNPLHKQLKHDDKGNILEIYEKPTGKTDAVAMQHDVDYSICGKKPKKEQVKCKNEADVKMVRELDKIPWRERQWGHSLARNMITGKKIMGVGGALARKRGQHTGGALARLRGSSTTDKIAYVASNFVTPAPSFAALGRLLAGQAFKGIKDNVDYYRGSGNKKC